MSYPLSLSPLFPFSPLLNSDEDPLISNSQKKQDSPPLFTLEDSVNQFAKKRFSDDVDLPPLLRASSGLKRSYSALQESDPSVENMRNVFVCTSGFDALLNKLQNAKTFQSLVDIIRSWENEIPQHIKNEEQGRFGLNLEKALESMTHQLMGLRETNPDFFSKIREAKKSLDLLMNCYGKLSLNDELYENIFRPFRNEIEKLQHTEPYLATKLAEKFIAKKKGQEVRDSVVTPAQIYTLIKDSLIGVSTDDEMLDISRALARQILEMTENKETYRGKCCELKANDKSYTFATNDRLNPRQLTLNFNCHLQFSNDENCIEIYIHSNGVKRLPGGAYKAPFINQCYILELKTSKIENFATLNTYKRNGSYQPIVLQNIKKVSDLPTIDQGISMQRIAKAQDPSISIAALPRKLNALMTKENSDGVAYVQDWYNTDLFNAVLNSEIPSDISEDSLFTSLSFHNIFKSIYDVAVALNQSHKSHIIHNDVKPSNIFLKLDPTGKHVQGFIADYDLAQYPGLHSSSTGYIYWDTLCNLGIVTPFTDVFGLALTLVQSVFKNFGIDASNILDQNYQDKILLRTFRKILNYHDEFPEKTDGQTIKFLEDSIIKKIQKTVGTRKRNLLIKMAHMQAIKATLKIFLKVIRNDQYLSNNFINSLGPTWKCVNNLDLIDSPEKRNEILVKEMETFGYFDRDFGSRIENWQSLNPTNKLDELKKYFDANVNNHHLDKKWRNSFDNYFKEIKIRESTLRFLKQMNDLPPEDRRKHPLYRSLNKIRHLDQNKKEQLINEEVKKIQFMNPSFLEFTAKERFKYFNNRITERNDFKELLNLLISDENTAENLRKESIYFLDQIVMIENTMSYAFDTHKLFLDAVIEAPKHSMNMEHFLAELKPILETLDPEMIIEA